jgi:hypothetical protein
VKRYTLLRAAYLNNTHYPAGSIVELADNVRPNRFMKSLEDSDGAVNAVIAASAEADIATAAAVSAVAAAARAKAKVHVARLAAVIAQNQDALKAASDAVAQAKIAADKAANLRSEAMATSSAAEAAIRAHQAVVVKAEAAASFAEAAAAGASRQAEVLTKAVKDQADAVIAAEVQAQAVRDGVGDTPMLEAWPDATVIVRH